MHHAPHLVTIGNTHTRRRRRRRGHCPLGPPRAAPVQPTLPCPRCEYCDFCTASSYSASAYSSSRGCVVGRALLRALRDKVFELVQCRVSRLGELQDHISAYVCPAQAQPPTLHFSKF